MSDPRGHRRYKTLRAKFKLECMKSDAPCWICGQPIDYTAEPKDRSGFELDHLYPVDTHPELAHDPANFRPSHAGCNARRGAEAPRPGLGRLSRNWLSPKSEIEASPAEGEGG